MGDGPQGMVKAIPGLINETLPSLMLNHKKVKKVILNIATCWSPASHSEVLYTWPYLYFEVKKITQSSNFKTLLFIFIFMRINTLCLTTISFFWLEKQE